MDNFFCKNLNLLILYSKIIKNIFGIIGKFFGFVYEDGDKCWQIRVYELGKIKD